MCDPIVAPWPEDRSPVRVKSEIFTVRNSEFSLYENPVKNFAHARQRTLINPAGRNS
jgi:hypothetical protein